MLAAMNFATGAGNSVTTVSKVGLAMENKAEVKDAKANKGNKTSTIIMSLEVHNAAQVSLVMGKIRRLKDVFSVSRAMASAADNNSNTRHGR